MNRKMVASFASGLALLVLVMAGIWVFRSRSNSGAGTSSQPKQQSTMHVLVEFAATPTPSPLSACLDVPGIRIVSPYSYQVVAVGQEIGFWACATGEHISRIDVQVDGQLVGTLRSESTEGVSTFLIGRSDTVFHWAPTQSGSHTIQLLVYGVLSESVLMKSEPVLITAQEFHPLDSPVFTMPMPTSQPPSTTDCVVTVTDSVFSPTQKISSVVNSLFGISINYKATCNTRTHVAANRLNANEGIPPCDAITVISDTRSFWTDQQLFSPGEQSFSRQFILNGSFGEDRLFIRLLVIEQGTDRLLACRQEVYFHYNSQVIPLSSLAPTPTPPGWGPGSDVATAIANTSGTSLPSQIATPIP